MRVTNTGSFILFEPESDEEREWIDENVETESWQWLGNALAVDSRMAFQLAEGMQADGINIGE